MPCGDVVQGRRLGDAFGHWSRLSNLRLETVPIRRCLRPNGPPSASVGRYLRHRCSRRHAARSSRFDSAGVLRLPACWATRTSRSSMRSTRGHTMAARRPVVVESALSCVPRDIKPVCRQCAAGRFTLCENFRTGPCDRFNVGWNSFTGGSWHLTSSRTNRNCIAYRKQSTTSRPCSRSMAELCTRSCADDLRQRECPDPGAVWSAWDSGLDPCTGRPLPPDGHRAPRSAGELMQRFGTNETIP